MEAGAPAARDYFGTEADVAAARAAPADARTALALAWMLRQRDTTQALAYAAQAEQMGSRDTGRIALVRAEAAWLAHDGPGCHQALAQAEAVFAEADDPLGLGDAALLRATVQDQAGADCHGPLDTAEAHYQAAGAADRLRLLAAWRGCIDPDAAAAEPPASPADDTPGLRAYAEAARGWRAWRRGDPAAAITAFQAAFDAALASGQLQSAVTLAQNLGIAFSTLNDHEGALAWAERARMLVEPTGWVYHRGWCLMQTGAILVGLGRAAEARQLLEQGLPLFDGAQGSRNHALACQSLAEACLALGDDGAALAHCEQALAGARLSQPDLLPGLLRHRALALSRLGCAGEAVASAQEALAKALAGSDEQRVPSIHHVLAQIAQRHGLPPPPGTAAPSAQVHHLTQALEQGRRLAGFQPPPEWLQEMSRAQQACGNLALALQFEREASDARRLQQQRRSEELATAMMVRHRTAQALAEAERARAQAESSELRAQLQATQAELERERLQTLLVHAGKLAAIGRLAAGLVHEMSHPVGTVLLLSESLLQASASGPPALCKGLQAVASETRRLQDLITRLRRFARSEPLQLAEHDLAAVLTDARQLYGPRLRAERIPLQEAVPAARVRVDPQRLALALANLVFNALEALAGRPDGQLWVHGHLGEAGLQIHVDDNGPGLAAEVQQRLFEPFFTTRPDGLGLGLTLSREAVVAMGGELTAVPRPGGGARFTIALPWPG